MSLGSNGWIGCVRCENSTARFFVPKVAKTALRVSFATLFRRKPNYENATNMSLGQTGWMVRSLRKIQLQVFLLRKVAKTALPGEFRDVVPIENRNSKNATIKSFGQTGWIGCVRCEKSNCEFFCSKSR
jgi:hypothetical protein